MRLLYDIFEELAVPGVHTMLEVNNGWLITDNTWLWKADHCVDSSGPGFSLLTTSFQAFQLAK